MGPGSYGVGLIHPRPGRKPEDRHQERSPMHAEGADVPQADHHSPKERPRRRQGRDAASPEIEFRGGLCNIRAHGQPGTDYSIAAPAVLFTYCMRAQVPESNF